MSNIGWAVLLICALSAGTLFFSVNGVALRIFSRSKLHDAFKATHREKLMNLIVERSEKLIWTCSVYRLICNMGILLCMLIIFTRLRQNGGQTSDYVFSFVVALAIFLVFGVAVPQALAKYTGEKILSKTYGLLAFASTLILPVLLIIQSYDGFIRRLAGVTESTPEEEQEEKQEEFLSDLEQQRMEGVMDEEEQEMIENVLELSDTEASEIMTPRTDIVAVEASSDLQTVLKTITGAGHTRVPVYKENIDNITGFVYAKDLLSEIGKNPADFKISNELRKPYFVPETKPLRVLLHEFQNQKLHIAVVLDEYGGTAGIVTLEDILEELVGEIADEYEKTSAEAISKIDENTIEVDARTYVDDLNDQFELDLPEDEDYDTVGGFVFSYLGYIPKTGEKFDYENLKFTISAAEARKIKRIRIQKITAQ